MTPIWRLRHFGDVTTSDKWRFPDLLGAARDHGANSLLPQRDAARMRLARQLNLGATPTELWKSCETPGRGKIASHLSLAVTGENPLAWCRARVRRLLPPWPPRTRPPAGSCRESPRTDRPARPAPPGPAPPGQLSEAGSPNGVKWPGPRNEVISAIRLPRRVSTVIDHASCGLEAPAPR